jgi:hypothetical protein
MAKHYVAVDPLSLLLPTPVYIKINLPRPPEEILAQAREAVKVMNAKEKEVTLAKAEAMITYGSLVKKALKG